MFIICLVFNKDFEFFKHRRNLRFSMKNVYLCTSRKDMGYLEPFEADIEAGPHTSANTSSNE